MLHLVGWFSWKYDDARTCKPANPKVTPSISAQISSLLSKILIYLFTYLFIDTVSTSGYTASYGGLIVKYKLQNMLKATIEAWSELVQRSYATGTTLLYSWHNAPIQLAQRSYTAGTTILYSWHNAHMQLAQRSYTAGATLLYSWHNAPMQFAQLSYTVGTTLLYSWHNAPIQLAQRSYTAGTTLLYSWHNAPIKLRSNKILLHTKKKSYVPQNRPPFHLFQEATYVYLRESRVYVLWEDNIKRDRLKMRKD